LLLARYGEPAFCFLGRSAGQLVMIPAAVWLTLHFGWRSSFFWLGVSVFVTAIPLTLLGGLLLGVLQQLFAGYLPTGSVLAQGLRPSLPFVALFLLLLFWPGLRPAYLSGPLVLGQGGDIPVPGSFGGNRLTEPAVWRPSTGRFFFVSGYQHDWGKGGDIPLPNAATT
jgi:hypothetical protein